MFDKLEHSFLDLSMCANVCIYAHMLYTYVCDIVMYMILMYVMYMILLCILCMYVRIMLYMIL